jgi:hypothetical protein
MVQKGAKLHFKSPTAERFRKKAPYVRRSSQGSNPRQKQGMSALTTRPWGACIYTENLFV